MKRDSAMQTPQSNTSSLHLPAMFWAAIAVAVSLTVPGLAAAASLLAPPQLPESAFADTEAETNLVFDAGTARDNKWRLSIELDAKWNLARVVRRGAIPANERVESRVTRDALAILVR